jgi:cytochrome b561
MNKPYDRISQTLHWVMTLLIFSAYFIHPEDDERGAFVIIAHISLGVLMLGFFVLGLLWYKTKARIPAPLPTTPKQHLLRSLLHKLLYLLMFVVPLFGLLLSLSDQHKYLFMGLMELPKSLILQPALRFFEQTHELTASLLFFLAVAHIALVVVHHFRFKNGLMDRMTK